MYIVGLHDGHNASVALYKDGELIFALQEERISREKNASGFPKESFKYMLDYFNIGINDIERFMIVSNHMNISNEQNVREKMMESFGENVTLKRKVKDQIRHTGLYSIWQKKLRDKKISACVAEGIPADKLEFVEHHTTHANTAYYCSHFNAEDDVLIVTMDGGGDRLSVTISVSENGKVKRIHSIPDSDSLGFIYSSATWYMGMVPNEHEYKIMGLAPYAKKHEYEPVLNELRKILYFKNPEDVTWTRGINSTTFQVAKHFEKIFKRKRFDIIAGALQEYTEEMMVELIRRNLQRYNLSKVCCSGGVFMNVKANQKIAELDEVEDLFIMPSCGDETNSIGAALEYFATTSDKSGIAPLADNFCIGPELKREEVEKELEAYKDRYDITYHEDVEKEVARLLSENNVVARVSGGMEFGARALGHRSILANPSSFENVNLINEMIKKRDFWMPFAGSYKAEEVDTYFTNPKNLKAPYMILTFETINGPNKEVEGAIHPFDKTTRPQIVSKTADEKYWNLIGHFKQMTGIGAVLNTSFNLHGLPVAFNVKDSMHVMDHSGLNYLAIDNYIVKKKEGFSAN